MARNKMSAPIIFNVPNTFLSLDNIKTEEVVQTPSPPSRKRRLDHLSWEEKMQRKKLKNRVAAQTSRDRKKAKMDEMELRIKEFMMVNHKLLKEVESLKALNERLLCENTLLKSESAARTVPGAPRPAVSNPQQKDGPPAALRAARLLLAMCLLLQTSSPNSTQTTALKTFSSLQTPSSKRLVRVLQAQLKMEKYKTLRDQLKDMKWWGPHQSTWNPLELKV